jgi:hypothetical protein
MQKTNDFIGIYDAVMTREECQEVITYFNEMKKYNLVFDRQAMQDGLSHERSDQACFLMDTDTFYLGKTHPVLVKILEKLWSCYTDYVKKYSMLAISRKHGMTGVKIQHTKPGEGFHNWHYENNGVANSNRFAAFTIYLNTVVSGGETEFLYQKTRVNAVEGRVVIWPGAFTHTHRGNMPLSGDKYIVTGWIEFFE